VNSESRPSRRQLQAEQTRRDIVAAARVLFAQQGYTQTSVSQIAEAAGVSVQTIYDSLGSKGAIVAQLNDLVDEEGGVAPLAARIPREDVPAELIAIAVAISRQINERCEDVIRLVYGAAALEPELAMVRDESIRRHSEGIRGLTQRLADLDALSERVTVEDAADVIAALLTPQVARTFVFDYGWSFDRWEEWTRETLCSLILKTPERAT
jgi:AcrR family transcriptional regulator